MTTRGRVDAWVIDLREQLVEAGHDRRRVEALLSDTLTRYRTTRLPPFVPLLVERSVQRALRVE